MTSIAKFILALGFIFYCFSVETDAGGKDKIKDAAENWDTGTLYFNDGSTLLGKLLYHPEKELVFMENQGKIIAYSAQRLIKFSYNDEFLSVERNYISVTVNNKGYLHKKYFFEVVMLGDLTLLRQQKSRSHCDGYYDEELKQFIGYTSHFNYFFLYKGGIYPLKNFKKQYKEIVGDAIHHIDEYIKATKLSFKYVPHQVKMIHYFNKLDKNETSKLIL